LLDNILLGLLSEPGRADLFFLGILEDPTEPDTTACPEELLTAELEPPAVDFLYESLDIEVVV
jgi:hypothetical protein